MREIGLSVVIPAYNEEKNINLVINELIGFFSDKKNIKFEIIIVNDASMDKTLSIAEKLSKLYYPHVKTVSNKTNKGLGESLRVGFNQAQYEYLTWFPGDNEIVASGLQRYLELINPEKNNIIIGYILNNHVRTRFRVILSKMFSYIFSKSFFIDLNYTNGLALIPEAIYDKIENRSKGFTFQTELNLKIIYSGYDYYHIGYELKPRLHGKTKALTLRNLIDITKTYVRLWVEIFIIHRKQYFKKGKKVVTSKSYDMDGCQP